MANVKQYRMQYRVPFDWIERLPDSEALAVCGWMASPHDSECSFEYQYDGMGPVNEHGGQTTMYLLELYGESGASIVFMARVASAFRESGWEVVVAEARDLEDPSAGEWFHLPDFDYDKYAKNTTKPEPDQREAVTAHG